MTIDIDTEKYMVLSIDDVSVLLDALRYTINQTTNPQTVRGIDLWLKRQAVLQRLLDAPELNEQNDYDL